MGEIGGRNSPFLKNGDINMCKKCSKNNFSEGQIGFIVGVIITTIVEIIIFSIPF